MASAIVMALPTQKPRIGFSIESIVGSEKQSLAQQTPPPSHPSPNSESSERPLSPLGSSDSSHYPPEALPHPFRGVPHFQHLPHQRAASYLQSREFFATVGQRMGRAASGTPPQELSFRNESPHSPEEAAARYQSSSTVRLIDLSSNSSRSSPPPAHTRLNSPELEPGATRNEHSRSPRSSISPGPGPGQGGPPKGPIVVPGMVPGGLVRPFPMNHGEPLKSLPAFIGGNGAAELAAVQAAHNQHNFLAAQYQAAAAAAALAHVQASQGQGGFPGHPGQHPHHHPHHHPLHNHPANIPRESYPLYPWLLSRHGRNVFPPRFPGSKYRLEN
uniref:Homeobox domain-containing protein n=1 Tax=Anopheles farauti TaxID=69004 RepID=A0A182QXM6_9DIPT